MRPGSSIGLFSSWGICSRHVSACQRCFCLRLLWSRLVLGRPLRLQGPIPIFFLILPMVPLEVARLITGEAPPGFHLLGSHSMSHLHLEDRIIGYGLLQITGDVQPLVIFLRRLVAVSVCFLLGWRLRMARAIFLNLRDGGSKGRGLMKSRLITRGMAISLQLTVGRTGTLAFQPLVTGYIGFISFDGLIHLLWS